MTSVLIIDSGEEGRALLEERLTSSNQFQHVYSCAALSDGVDLIELHQVEVVLIERGLADDASVLGGLKSRFPDLGIVVVSDGLYDASEREFHRALGVHAQTTHHSAPMDMMASIAKALVARLAPKSRLFKKVLRS